MAASTSVKQTVRQARRGTQASVMLWRSVVMWSRQNAQHHRAASQTTPGFQYGWRSSKPASQLPQRISSGWSIVGVTRRHAAARRSLKLPGPRPRLLRPVAGIVVRNCPPIGEGGPFQVVAVHNTRLPTAVFARQFRVMFAKMCV